MFGITGRRQPVRGRLQDPNAEPSRASDLLATKFGQGDLQMLITISSDDGVRSSTAVRIGAEAVHRLESWPYVARVMSPWTEPPSASASLISRHTTARGRCTACHLHGLESQTTR